MIMLSIICPSFNQSLISLYVYVDCFRYQSRSCICLWRWLHKDPMEKVPKLFVLEKRKLTLTISMIYCKTFLQTVTDFFPCNLFCLVLSLCLAFSVFFPDYFSFLLLMSFWWIIRSLIRFGTSLQFHPFNQFCLRILWCRSNIFFD